MTRDAVRKFDELPVALVVEQASDFPGANAVVEMIYAGLLWESDHFDLGFVEVDDREFGEGRVEKLDRASLAAPTYNLSDSKGGRLPARPYEHEFPASILMIRIFSVANNTSNGLSQSEAYTLLVAFRT
jgi:hypothetical protein